MKGKNIVVPILPIRNWNFDNNQQLYSQYLRTDSTYKELKLSSPSNLIEYISRTDSTYKELKLEVAQADIDLETSTDSTYKELKLSDTI